MSSNKFKVGDKVKLKSGSPVMVISYIDRLHKFFGGAYIHCEWTDKQGRPQGAIYKPELLVKA